MSGMRKKGKKEEKRRNKKKQDALKSQGCGKGQFWSFLPSRKVWKKKTWVLIETQKRANAEIFMVIGASFWSWVVFILGKMVINGQ